MATELKEMDTSPTKPVMASLLDRTDTSLGSLDTSLLGSDSFQVILNKAFGGLRLEEPFKPTPVCLFCGIDRHTPVKCPRKRYLRDQCRDRKDVKGIRPIERLGFCAAGFAIFDLERKHVLMIEELREGKRAYNLPGGKRDAEYETPLVTALRELREELYGKTPRKEVISFFQELLSDISYRPPVVTWYAPGKYVLHTHFTFLKKEIEGPVEYGNQLKWIPYDEVLTGKIPVHSFAFGILTESQ
jgi:8-oxo-dGTP pyrophosphatase MutT (NUDIX family)